MPLLPITALLPTRRVIHRRLQAEWMDQPDIDPALHRGALDGLARINALSGSAAALWPPIEKAASAQPDRPLRVLDVACGGGDVTLGLWQRAKQRGIAIELTGCDVSPVAIERARQQADKQYARIEFIERDALQDDWPGAYDVAVTSLFLHHLEQAEIVTLLNRLAEHARLVIADDLVRSTPGWLLAWSGTRLLTRSPVVHVDGPRSVENALRPAELGELARQAGLEDCMIKRHWPARMQLVWSRA